MPQPSHLGCMPCLSIWMGIDPLRAGIYVAKTNLKELAAQAEPFVPSSWVPSLHQRTAQLSIAFFSVRLAPPHMKFMTPVTGSTPSGGLWPVTKEKLATPCAKKGGHSDGDPRRLCPFRFPFQPSRKRAPSPQDANPAWGTQRLQAWLVLRRPRSFPHSKNWPPPPFNKRRRA